MADLTTLGIAVDSSGVTKATDGLHEFKHAGEEAAESASGFEAAMEKAVLVGELMKDAIEEVAEKAIELAKEFRELIMAVGEYQDMALKIGSNDPAGLSSLKTAADTAGVSMQDMTSSMNRMARALSEAGGDSSRAALGLKAIGINVAEFKALDPVAQMDMLAKSLDEYGNSQQKVQVMQMIMGRGGAEYLVLMEQLAKENARHTYLTNEQIIATDELEKSMKRNRSETVQMIQALGSEGLLPVITETMEAVHSLVGEFVSAEDKGKSLSATAAVLEEWGRFAVNIFVDVYEFAAAVAAGIASIGVGIKLLKDLEDPSMSNAQAWDSFKGRLDDVSNTYDKAMKLRGKLQESRLQQDIKDATGPIDTGVDWDGKPAKPEKKKISDDALHKPDTSAVDAYQAIIDKIREKELAEQQEYDTGKPIDKATEFRNGILKQLTDNYDLLGKKARDQILLEADHVTKIIAANEAYKEEVKWMAEDSKETATNIDAMRKRAEELEKASKKAQENNDRFGETKRQTEQRHVDDLRAQADMALTRKMQDDGWGTWDQYNAQIEREAKALRDTADATQALYDKQNKLATDPKAGAIKSLQDYVDKAKDVGTATAEAMKTGQGMLEDSLTNFVTKGKLDFSSLIDYIISETVRLTIIRPMLAYAFGGGSGTGGLIGLLMGMGGGGASGVNAASGSVGFSAGATGSFASGITGFAGGGDPPLNMPSLVGEKGPELFVPKTAGTVIPNGSLGGHTFNINPVINIDSRSDAAQVQDHINVSLRESNKQLIKQLSEAGMLR